MAKDGTNQGGRRVRAGGKAKPLAGKIAEGIPATIMELPISGLEAKELEGTQELAGEDMPNPSEYLSARQKDGRPLGADEISGKHGSGSGTGSVRSLSIRGYSNLTPRHLQDISRQRKPSLCTAY